MATTIEWLTGKMPKVLLSPQVKGDMDAVVAHGGSDEIGWLGFVRRLDFDFEVYRIVLPQQEVHAATTEITPAGIAEIVEELLTSATLRSSRCFAASSRVPLAASSQEVGLVPTKRMTA